MIGILPYENRNDLDLNSLEKSQRPCLTLLKRRPHLFTFNGRSAMAALFRKLNLQPHDEVYITTTTGQAYVSSCVTCTVFNFCKPSRVLTDATKAIFIIHEYGLPHPQLLELAETGRRRGLPVIEDCAHGFDSELAGRRLGDVGDYVIFSLSKLLPMSSGGILVGDELPDSSGDSPEAVERIRREFDAYEPFLDALSLRRRENFAAMRGVLSGYRAVFELEDHITPTFLGVFMSQAPQIRRIPAIEWGSTLQENLLLIPTNPMVSSRTMVRELLAVLDTVP